MPAPLHPSPAADAPFAWRADSFGTTSPWLRPLSAQELSGLDALASQDAARTHDAHDPGEPAPMPAACEALAADMRRAVYRGPGFILLRGLPYERWGVDGARWVTWTLAHALGTPVTQTAAGARLVDVRDLSRKESSPRQFSTSQELRLHMDPASDLIGLGCVRAAASGGESVLTSAVSIHDEMLRQQPELLAALYEGFRWHRFGEGRPQDGPISEPDVPVFTREGGHIACRYVRSPIVAGHKEAGEPLTARQIQALDLFDQVAASPQLRIVLRMQPGDLLWVNNIKVLHARTQFVDHPEPLPPRHLFRLWVAAPETEARAPARLNYFNGGACGMPLTGQKARYDMEALRKDPASGGVFDLGVSRGGA
ncbi:TauD/TfdA family dioxygenase [Ramlibacter sp. AW1]|uniref:TauD/TfdA family dioxygenase n=1 Tax=Ramlibacter aurantiacus TaxID=2801330 RepID=A0A936ZNR6_9BURK|nr:TauD/TfdA family dioxygenase [Ramlibacter aurantiacus]MBL0420693.1 TauD/TfdA family dioxygenase [Ramlibacter aurantiacus]